MMTVALKMLIGNKASCLGVIFGIFLAILLISQQSAIFLGLVTRSYRLVTDIPEPNIWIIDPATESDEKARSMPEGYLNVIRGFSNIAWAVPINVTHLPITTPAGIFDICQLYGVDDATFIGAPLEMVEGDVSDLRREGGVIIDIYSANSSLAKTLPDGTKSPMPLEGSFEINNQRAVVVGICKITQGFYPQPIVFTSNKQFHKFTSATTNRIDFIAAKTSPQADIDDILKKINSYPMFKGLTREQLKWRIAKSFLQTGILINFALSVILGIIIGFSIAGQTFYLMTIQNIKYFALIKSLGGNDGLITRMILFQTAMVGVLGFLLGTGTTILWGMAIEGTTLAFFFPWELLLFTIFITMMICLFTAGLSIRKVVNIDSKLLLES